MSETQVSSRICGAQNPRNTIFICTKEDGHEGRHGRPKIVYRSIFWDMRPAAETVE